LFIFMSEGVIVELNLCNFLADFIAIFWNPQYLVEGLRKFFRLLSKQTSLMSAIALISAPCGKYY